MWRGKGSLPEGEAVCLACRRALGLWRGKNKKKEAGIHGACARCGVLLVRRNQRRFCSVRCANITNPSRFKRWLTAEEREARKKARGRNSTHRRREKTTRVRDLTLSAEIEMRRTTRKCPLCRCWMTNKPYLANSKELDHIVPLFMGGTHTFGNVRVICKTCNSSRPKDGSDFEGQVTLWAQAPEMDGLPLVTKKRRKPKKRGPRDPSMAGWGSKPRIQNIYWFNCRFCGVLAYNRRTPWQTVCVSADCQKRRLHEAQRRWAVRNGKDWYAEDRPSEHVGA